MNTFQKNVSVDTHVQTLTLQAVREIIAEIREQVNEDRAGLWSARTVLDTLTSKLDTLQL